MGAVRKETGETYIEPIREQRLKTAKVLLQDTAWAIKDIATFLGYTTPDYFRIMFHRHTGLAPKNYRFTIRKR